VGDESKQVSVWVRASDAGLWRRAVAYARERRMTTSGLIMLALQRYLDEHDDRERR
jgi:hypothetical protein